MDGFNTIPVQSSSFKSGATKENETTFKSVNVPENTNINIEDEDQKKDVVEAPPYILYLGILSIFLVFGYLGYLLFMRYAGMQEIATLGEEFNNLSQNINKDEVDEFVQMDKSLKLISQKINSHVLISKILGFVNSNIRNNVQVMDYRVEVKDREVLVTLVNVAPGFKELAEQTEKMFELRTTGEIKSFTVSALSLESDGRKVRYNLNIVFDRAKVSAGNEILTQNSIIRTEERANNFTQPDIASTTPTGQ